MADPNEAVRHFIHSLGKPPNAHSVYLQTRSYRDGTVQHVIMCHRAPGEDFPVPDVFDGYAVEIHPWSRPYDGVDSVP